MAWCWWRMGTGAGEGEVNGGRVFVEDVEVGKAFDRARRLTIAPNFFC